ncbi:MAG: regulatory protein GemA [Thermodesulfobacteriota bacterium]
MTAAGRTRKGKAPRFLGPPDERRALIAKAHLAAAQLGLDEETRRAVQAQVTGHASCAGMSVPELERLLTHYRGKGWTARPSGAARAQRQAAFPQARLIRALWLELRDLGELRDASEGALRSYVRRITGVAALEWLAKEPQKARQVIETLKKWIARVQRERAQAQEGGGET